MAESALRRKKRAELAASARRLTPAQRIHRASIMTDAGLKLRAAGRRALAKGHVVREAPAGRNRSPFRDLERILAILRALKLPHALIGGWAVIARGSLRTSEDIDLMPARGAADRAALARASAVTAEGVTIPVVQADDLIAIKLEAGGGQDYEDARQLLAICVGTVDEDRLLELCRQRKVLDRLALLRR